MPSSPVLRPDDGKTKAIPIHLVSASALPALLKTFTLAQKNSIKAAGFKADSGSCFLRVDDHGVKSVLFGIGNGAIEDPFLLGKLSSLLPEGTYRFAEKFAAAPHAALAFVLETYRFDRYRRVALKKMPILLFGTKEQCAALQIQADAVFLARDLINTPANDLGPEELAAAVATVAKHHQVKLIVTSGKTLEKEFPLIHAVGKASPRAPRLIDMTWGKASHPKLTLVGKGVVFDTGGLDIKPSSGMLMMKKDMGGAACTLALAQMIMAAKLPVRLRLLIPAVENSISGSSFRPGDVLQSRKKLTIEIGNTDAEGRLVLADALCLATEERPDLIIDMATLTGAARVALGPELPPFFTDDEKLASDISAAAAAEYDPLWRMPLHKNYKALFKSKIADLNNAGATSFAGAITAALFLQAFTGDTRWVHVDTYAWNATASPGRPEGAEALGVRALFSMIQKRYGKRI